MYLGGNVWEDMPSIKIGDYTGQREDSSLSMAGIQVELYDNNHNKIVARTLTDESGKYGFQKINPLLKYKVIFTYDGMRFENTKYTNNLSGGYSTATEDLTSSDTRSTFNDYFDRIESSPHNYHKDGDWRKAYGLYSKLEDSGEDYIEYDNEGTNEGAFRYYDALEIFKRLATNSHKINSETENDMKSTYYKVGTGMGNGYYETVDYGYSNIEGEFIDELTGLGMSDEEAHNVWQYINDTFIKSTTIPYPEQNKFVLEDVDELPGSGTIIGYDYLYISSRDQSRNVDFGIKLRSNADLYLAKDIYKATLLVNGKKQEYYYNKKKSETDAEGNWVLNLDTGTYEYSSGTSDASERANSEDYIGESSGGSVYTREIRKSEYLYDGSDIGSSDAKNLQAFITYKIAVKNQTQDVWTSVDEIVDYFDGSQYYSILDLPNSTIIKENTYVGDSKGNKIYDLKVSDQSTYVEKYGSMSGYYNQSNNINETHDYKAIYLTGIRSVESGNRGAIRLMPGEITYAYITFKVQNDPDTGKVKIDQKIEDLLNDNINNDTDLVGKRNIAEINGYSTYFGSSSSEKAGLIDLDSNAGSLKPRDLNEYGDIISSQSPVENRLEDDEDKANNIKLKINTDKEDERSIAGYTFEDARTEISNGAVIGNGKYNENDKDFEENADKKINGITVQLVELVKEVDEQGFVTGNYEKEYIWSRVTYTKNGNTWNQHIDDTRYYSGTEGGQVILSGQGIFAVTPSALNKDAGEYKFDSVPPGDFFVRFIYGDTTQTVLTNITETSEGYTDYTDKYGTKDEVQELLNKLTNEQKNAFVQGANEQIKINNTSQEKGTNIPAYQRILGTSGLNRKSYTGQDYKSTIYQLGVNQNPEINNYNGIVGYTNTELQNYNRNDANDKNAMYNYDIYQSDKNTSNGSGQTIGDGISDAKDVYSYRMDERNYSLGSTSNLEGDIQTLKNHRAEVLASGTKLVTKAEKSDADNMLENAVEIQRDAIKELIENTTMVAQSGVINMEVEYNRQQTDVYNAQSKQYVQNLVYRLEDLDLGLTERPEAQLQVTKELTNVQIKLANGSILFDANQSVPNLVYGKHKIYGKDEYYYNEGTNDNPGYRLRHDIQKTIKERQEELVLATMDEEIMSGARIRLIYKLSVDNIGEVDYLDTDFYFKGKTNNTNWENVSRTNALNVLDYVTNEMNFEVNYQDDVNDWKLITTDDLLGTNQDETAEKSGSYNAETLNRVKEDNDYVNSYYKENLDTYNVLIRTEKLSGDLIPRALETDLENLSNSRREVNLMLSTLLSNTLADKNIIYTNLAEIIEINNTWGRRLELSKTGDEEVPYQSAEDKSIDESTEWVQPKGPDADSGQKVQILAPTGENKNYQRAAVIIICILGIIIIGVIVIKNRVLKDEN